MDASLAYDEKLSALQVYRQYLENWLRKNEGAVQEMKMKTLYDLVSGKKRSNLETLAKCEVVLQKLQPNTKCPIVKHGIDNDSRGFASPISFDEGSSSPLVTTADGPQQGSGISSERSHNKPSRRGSVSRDRYEQSSSVYDRQDGPTRRSDTSRSAERSNHRDAQPEFNETRSRSASLRIKDRRSTIDSRDRNDPKSDRSFDKRSGDRNDSKSAVADRHANDQAARNRSKSTTRSSPRSNSPDRPVSRDRQRRLSPEDMPVYEPPVTRKSEVFKRLGNKVPPKRYENLSIELHKESASPKSTSKSPVNLESIDDNNSNDSSNLNALLEIKSKLTSEIQSLDSTKKTVSPTKANTESIISLVQQAMANQSLDTVSDRPVSPTALLAVQQVLAKQAKPDNFDAHRGAASVVAVEERLAHKYSPKPRSKTTSDIGLLPTPQPHKTTPTPQPHKATMAIGEPALLPTPIGRVTTTTPTLTGDVAFLPSPPQPRDTRDQRDPRLILARRQSISCGTSPPSLPSLLTMHCSPPKPKPRQQTYGEYCRARDQQHNNPKPDRPTHLDPARRIAHEAKATAGPSAEPHATDAKKKKQRWDVPPLKIAAASADDDDAAASSASVTPSSGSTSSVARSQFDDIYRVNNYGRTVGSVTHMNANIIQNFKIPKKKSAATTPAIADKNTDDVPMDIETHTDDPTPAETTTAKNPAVKLRLRTMSIDSRRDPRLEARKMRELDASVKSPLSASPDKLLPAEEVTSTSMAAAASAATAAAAAAKRPSVSSTIAAPSTDEVSSSSSTAADAKKTAAPTEEAPKRLVESMLVDMQQLSKQDLLAMLSKALELDESKVGKIQQILENEDDNAPGGTESTSSESAAVTAVKSAEPPVAKTKAKPAKRLNELQKLNEDIRTMFISDGVLTATGRRMCTTAKSSTTAAVEDEKVTTRRRTMGTKSTLNDDGAADDTPAPARITRRRNTVCVSQNDTSDTRASITSRHKPKTTAAATSAATRKSNRARKRASSDGEHEDDVPAIKIKPLAAKKPAPTTVTNVASDDETPTRRQLRSSLPPRINKVSVVLAKICVEQMIEEDQMASKRAAATAAAAAPSATAARCPDDAIILKNTDKSMHAMNGDKNRHCLLCDYRGIHLIAHYANDHPSAENYLARVPQVMGDQLHTVKGLRRLGDAERLDNSKLRQKCIFCVEMRDLNYTQWLSHYSGHTGELMYECLTCGHLTSQNKHICNTIYGKMKRRDMPQFDRVKLTAFVCKLCNFTQFERQHVVRHLINQHGLAKAVVESGANMTEVDCMRFDCEASLSRSMSTRKRYLMTAAQATTVNVVNVKREKLDDEVAEKPATPVPIRAVSKKEKLEPVATDSSATTTTKRSVADVSDSDSDVAFRRHTRSSGRLTRLAKRRKSHRMLDDDDDTEDFPDPSDHNDQSDAFDNVRMTNELPFGSDKPDETATSAARSSPAHTSMADRLNERFKSVRKKNADARKSSSSISVDTQSTEKDAAAVEPPLSPNGEALLKEFERIQHLYKDDIPIELMKPVADDTDSAAEPETCHTDTIRTPARPKPIIAKTPLIIKESPSVMAGKLQRQTSKVVDDDITVILDDDDDEDGEWEDCSDEDDDGNAAATTTPVKAKPSSLLMCDETLGEEVTVNKPSVVVVTPSPPQPLSAVPSTSASVQSPPATAHTTATQPQKNNTIVDIVNRLSQSISFVRTMPSVTMPAANSLTRPPANVVYCKKAAEPAPRTELVKTINRIDNIGYSVFNNRTGFCCLVDGCGFESAMLYQLSSHLKEHQLPWTGYCFMCDKQIHNTNFSLSFELKHMKTVHVLVDPNKATPSEAPAKASNEVDIVQASRPNLVFRRLPGDQLSTTKSTINTAAPATAVVVPATNNTSGGGGIQIGSVISLAKSQLPTQSVTIPVQVGPSRMFTISKVSNGSAVVSAMQPYSAPLKITNVISLNNNADPKPAATSSVVAAASTTPTVSITKAPLPPMQPQPPPPPQDIPQQLAKPWTTSTNYKTIPALTEMLRHICLFALHKCMSPDCTFTNNSNPMALAHLRYHERTAFDPLLVAPANSLRRPWLECPYCQLIAASPDALVTHVDTEHRSSIFQCPHCFYRACAAYNVLQHQAAMHQNLPVGVLVCLGRPRALSVELPLIIASRALHVRQLQCDRDCKKGFYTIETYRQHMLESKAHGNQIVCPLCLKTLQTGMALSHQLHVHGIGRYACVYCPFGISDVAMIHEHMWREHPSKLPYVTCRVRRLNVALKTTTNRTADTLEETALAYVGNTVNKKFFTRCGYTEHELSQVSLAHMSLMCHDLAAAAPTNAATNNLEIVGVNSISKESFNAVSADSLISDVTGQTITFDQILNIADVEAYFFKHDLNEPWRKFLTNPPIIKVSSKKPATTKMTTPATTTTAVVPVRVVAVNGIPLASASTTVVTPSTVSSAPTSTISTTSSTAAGRHTELVQNEIDQAAYALVRDTGLDGRDLYRCAEAGCSATAIDHKEFNVHLMMHAANASFPCAHCNVRAPNIIGLLQHLRQQHARHMHFCYYCDHTGNGAKDLVKHMTMTHRKHDLTYVLLNPLKRQTTSPVVVCPRGIAPSALWQFGLNLLERYKRVANKTSYTPAEVALLPRAAILSQAISCAQCQYATKVRTNMVRHLAACTTSMQQQPPSDPVNPMPCLNTGERHFDKMRNLACSSNEGGVALELVSAFVPEKDRYVCNASGCRYQTINDTMLSNHLVTLHSNEPDYSCPHCALNLGSVDVHRIVDHLRLHGSRLYKCTKCMFHSSIRATVDAHVAQKHLDAITILMVRNEGASPVISIVDATQQGSKGSSASNQVRDSAAAATSDATVPATAAPSKTYKWVCMMCPESFANRALVRKHSAEVHSITCQYQCEECKMQFESKRAVEVHMISAHPDSQRLAKYFYIRMLSEETTPIWRRDDPMKVKHIRGILFEEDEATKPVANKRKSKSKPAKRTSTTSETDYVEIIDDPEASLIVVSDDETIPPSIAIQPSDTVKSPRTYAVQSSSVPSPPKPVTIVRVKNKRVGSDLAITPVSSNAAGVKMEKQITYIYNCKYCMKRMSSIELLYKHWQEAHKYKPKCSEQLNEGEPFIFYVDIHLRCQLCPNFNRIPKRTYRIHNSRIHPNCEIAMTEMNDTSQCGVCDFNSSDKEVLNAHFKSVHSFASQDDQSLMNRPLVPISEHNLRHLQFSGHQGRHKCLYCNEVLSYKEDFEKHHQIEHEKMPPLMQVLAETPRYACTICELIADTEQDVVQHLQHHNMYKFQKKYQCVHCDMGFGSKVAVRDHCIGAHGFNTNEWRLTPIESRLDVYERIKIIFPNGLMVCKAEVSGTKWGDMTDIIREISEIEALELADQYILQPERNKRKHGQDTTDPAKAVATLPSAASTTTTACNAEPRRQVARRSVPLPPLSEQRTTTPEPEEAFYSFYGQAPSTVDLKKVMTYITNGGTKVRLSCDQYAKFVNIAPELQLEMLRPEDYQRRPSVMDQSL